LENLLERVCRRERREEGERRERGERRELTFLSSIEAETFDRLSRHVFMLGTALNVYSDIENVGNIRDSQDMDS
jgi:hypothetical protein